MGVAFVIIVALIVIAIGAYYSHLQQQKRIAELSALAAEQGWRFDPGKNHYHDGQYSQFDIFTKGHSRYAYNTMHGTMEKAGDNWPVVMGDYHYKVTSGSGKNRSTSTYRMSYAIVQVPYVGVPDLAIREEHFFDKVAGFFGFDDIDFESAEFSDKFSVKSSNKKFAYDVVHPQMMQFLLDSHPPTIQLSMGNCCLSDGTRCWTPQQFRNRIDWVREFFNHWPQHVVSDLQQRALFGQ